MSIYANNYNRTRVISKNLFFFKIVYLLIMKRRKFIIFSIISSLLFLSIPSYSKSKSIIKKVKIGNKYWILSSEDF